MKLTRRSASRDSSMTFIAVKVKDVRPSVSMNVLCCEIDSATIGTEVSYFTFLSRPSTELSSA